METEYDKELRRQREEKEVQSIMRGFAIGMVLFFIACMCLVAYVRQVEHALNDAHAFLNGEI